MSRVAMHELHLNIERDLIRHLVPGDCYWHYTAGLTIATLNGVALSESQAKNINEVLMAIKNSEQSDNIKCSICGAEPAPLCGLDGIRRCVECWQSGIKPIDMIEKKTKRIKELEDALNMIADIVECEGIVSSVSDNECSPKQALMEILLIAKSTLKGWE